ncbi:MAG: NifB/NifX family molybdenum-iron cluster-binding protein [Campylobacterota bacterium]|nr:NifB/NifX family molybdenum-iron cluster-binding protein [Campylobacterota bacterium]
MKWLVGLLMVCSCLFSDIIAVASDGDSLSSNISSKASRCDFYIFLDQNGNIVEILKNTHKDIKGGASSQLVKMLKKKDISRFVASSLGDKLIDSLDSNNIKYTIHQGDINSIKR